MVTDGQLIFDQLKPCVMALALAEEAGGKPWDFPWDFSAVRGVCVTQGV
jgi:hypothetical protein